MLDSVKQMPSLTVQFEEFRYVDFIVSRGTKELSLVVTYWPPLSVDKAEQSFCPQKRVPLNSRPIYVKHNGRLTVGYSWLT